MKPLAWPTKPLPSPTKPPFMPMPRGRVAHRTGWARHATPLVSHEGGWVRHATPLVAHETPWVGHETPWPRHATGSFAAPALPIGDEREVIGSPTPREADGTGRQAHRRGARARRTETLRRAREPARSVNVFVSVRLGVRRARARVRSSVSVHVLGVLGQGAASRPKRGRMRCPGAWSSGSGPHRRLDR
jgi:hypothetical protein